MSNDWNIKDKEIDCSDIIGLAMIVDTKDIETLRQKLIEDLEKYYISWFARDYIIVGNKIKNIVNKRFGVKHDAKSKR